MNNFDLVVIGACHGFWLEDDVKKCTNKVLLIEPVKYNFDQLKNRFINPLKYLKSVKINVVIPCFIVSL